MSKEVLKNDSKKDGKTMKLPFSSQNVYSFPKNMDAKAAQTNSIAREPFQTQNKKNIVAKISNFSNIIMNEMRS